MNVLARRDDVATPSSGGGAMSGSRFSSRAMRVSLAKRLLLGLLMAAVAIVSGWFLSPNLGTDRATQEWYTQ